MMSTSDEDVDFLVSHKKRQSSYWNMQILTFEKTADNFRLLFKMAYNVKSAKVESFEIFKAMEQ